MKESRRRCARVAVGIKGLATIGMTTDDVTSEMLIEVVLACRSWARQHEGKPPQAYLNCAIRRKRNALYDAIRVKIEREFPPGRNPDWEPSMVPDRGDNPEGVTEAIERANELGDWSAIVAARLTPGEIGLLKLRALGWTNTEIAQQTGLQREGDEVHGVVKRRVWRARKKARDFLRACGIDGVEAAVAATPEDKDVAWEKATGEKPA